MEISYVEFTYREAGLSKTMLKLTLRLGSPLLEIKNNEAIRGIPLYILPLVALAQIAIPSVCNSSKTYVPAAQTLDKELGREVHRHQDSQRLRRRSTRSSTQTRLLRLRPRILLHRRIILTMWVIAVPNNYAHEAGRGVLTKTKSGSRRCLGAPRRNTQI